MKIATSLNENGAHPVENLIDKNTLTFYVVGDNPTNNPWVQLDLGGEWTIRSVVLVARYDSQEGANQLKNIEIFVGNRPEGSTQIPPSLENPNKLCGKFEGDVVQGQVVVIYCDPNTRGRYVQLRKFGHDPQYISIVEAMVFGGLKGRSKYRF